MREIHWRLSAIRRRKDDELRLEAALRGVKLNLPDERELPVFDEKSDAAVEKAFLEAIKRRQTERGGMNGRE